MRYTVVWDGTNLKGLQITIFNKQGKTTHEISYSYPADIEFANNLNVWANLQDVNFDGKNDILVNLDGRFMETAALTQTFRASKQPPLFTEKQYVKSKGLVTLHKDVSVDKIDRDWLSIIMK